MPFPTVYRLVFDILAVNGQKARQLRAQGAACSLADLGCAFSMLDFAGMDRDASGQPFRSVIRHRLAGPTRIRHRLFRYDLLPSSPILPLSKGMGRDGIGSRWKGCRFAGSGKERDPWTVRDPCLGIVAHETVTGNVAGGRVQFHPAGKEAGKCSVGSIPARAVLFGVGRRDRQKNL